MCNSVEQYLLDHTDDMYTLLRDLVLIQSGTHNKTGVDQVGERIAGALNDLDFEFKKICNKDLGDHLLVSSPTCKNGRKKILLIGHMDTVFPVDTDFNWYKHEGDKIFGPGVIDMKGGLVVMIFAIKALSACGLLRDIPITLFFNSDEEIGSPSSALPLRQEAIKSLCALVFECCGMNGEIVTARRGKCGYKIDITGRAGHAAFAGSAKASAIVQLSHHIQKLEALNNPDEGIVVNVGKVYGGIGPNTVPEHATALIDTRYSTPAKGDFLATEIEKIVSSPPCISGTQSILSITNSRPVMKPEAGNARLYSLYRDQAAALDITISEESRAGVSDANIVADEGIPVIDGLGPRGENDHSDREYMLAGSLVDQTRILSLFLPVLYRKLTES